MNEITKQESPTQKMARYLKTESVKSQFDSILKEQSGSFMASILECYNDKNLAGCEPSAVIIEALKAASLKLPLNKSLGYAYLVAYKNVPTFIIGYKGLTQLALRTGFYKYLNTGVIREGQILSENILTGEIELSKENNEKPVIGYFAYLELVNGFKKIVWMTNSQITAHAKKYSKSYGSEYSPWKNEFDAMAKKTVLRNILSHWGYMSIEMASAIATDTEEKEYEEIKPNSIPLQVIENKVESEKKDPEPVEEQPDF